MCLRAGAAFRVLNCALGDDLRGQLYRRICERVRDPLEANLLYLSNGTLDLLLVSLDLSTLETEDIAWLKAALEERTRIPAAQILLSCTHTHSGPQTRKGFDEEVPKNERFLREMRAALVDAAEEAVRTARPARAASATGQARIGYNRRLCWSDGTHTMYGEASRPDFTGLEGPDDPTHTILNIIDDDDRHISIIHNNSCHPTCVGGDRFASADFPGEARALLRAELGPHLPVLYLQGASGDISPWEMTSGKPRYDGQQRMREIGALLAKETLRLLWQTPVPAHSLLRHTFQELDVAIRLPTAAELDRARAIQAQGPSQAGTWEHVLAVHGVLALQEQFKDQPLQRLPLHALRVGEFALATNPCEPFCQFGLDLRRRSPAGVTAIAELTDGAVGYCPTLYGILGGGYSGTAIEWCRLEPAAGYKLVNASAAMLGALWRE